MDLCWRWPSLIALTALVGHTTSWFGTAGIASLADRGPGARFTGLLTGADSLISQIFAWLFVLIAFEVICCLVGYLVGEYKLRRLYDRPGRRWARPVSPPAPPPGPHPPL